LNISKLQTALSQWAALPCLPVQIDVCASAILLNQSINQSIKVYFKQARRTTLGPTAPTGRQEEMFGRTTKCGRLECCTAAAAAAADTQQSASDQ